MGPNGWSLGALLYEEDSFGIFVLVTIALGGGAAWLTGRAIAGTWRPWWQLPFYIAILALAVRFIHFALFEGTFLSPYYYFVDAVVCLILGALGFRLTRVRQMITQYSWIYRPAGAFGWRRAGVDDARSSPNSG